MRKKGQCANEVLPLHNIPSFYKSIPLNPLSGEVEKYFCVY